MGIQIGQIRAGQLATILVTGEHEMATGGTMGTPRNPLRDRVTRDHRLVARVSGVETYNRRLASQGVSSGKVKKNCQAKNAQKIVKLKR